MSGTFQFPAHLSRVRAWDRAEGRSVMVDRSEWEFSRRASFAAVQVSSADDAEHWYTPAAALDFRYFGEPSGAGWGERRQWARLATAGRREFWRVLHGRTTRQLLAELEAHEADMRARGVPDVQDTHLWRVARNELARRDGRSYRHPDRAVRPVNPPSAAVQARDRQMTARRRAAERSAEAYREWARADLEAHAR